VINRLSLKNFKGFENEIFNFRPLNVLTGKNSAGKSTIIQSLLLAERAAQSNDKTVKLNGPYSMELGTVFDVFRRGSTSQYIEIGISKNDCECNYKFLAGERFQDDPFLTLQEAPAEPGAALLKQINPFEFIYLSAERLGPRDTLGIQSANTSNMGLGCRGEYTAEVLKNFEDDRNVVQDGMLFPEDGEPNRRLKRQVELWMSDIFGELRIDVGSVPSTNIRYLRFEMGPIVTSESERPSNIGFGISYTLPIILAGLVCRKGGLLIVENPESHLHPAAQAKVACYLGRLASLGTQVILETHSDHVLNGIRVGVARGDINPDATKFIFMTRHADQSIAVFSPNIDRNGRLDAWPVDFFDEWDKALEFLLTTNEPITHS
jgi:predicted ATPase